MQLLKIYMHLITSSFVQKLHKKAQAHKSEIFDIIVSYKQQQDDGAPMESLLSPVVANLFIEDLETRAIQIAEHKPKLWLRYVDDIFMI